MHERGRTDAALLGLLGALRRRGDEAQFTQLIARACESDPSFAGGLAHAMLRHAGERASTITVPRRLECRVGRVDLVFRGMEDDFVLLVELKLHSAYGIEQLDRYRRALDTFPGTTALLLAVTVNTPFVGEQSVGGDPRWLGSIRWARLFPDMRSLPHESPHVGVSWRACLDLMRSHGDFGLMDVDISAVAGWARALEGEHVLRTTLREAAAPVEALLRDAPIGVPDPRLIARGKTRSQPVVPWRGRLHVPYSIGSPADEPRFRIQFHARHNTAMFSCEARYEHRKAPVQSDSAVQAASAFLRGRNFEVGTDGEGWYWAKSFEPTPWFSSPEPLDGLLSFAQAAVTELAESRIWPALSEYQLPAASISETGSIN